MELLFRIHNSHAKFCKLVEAPHFETEYSVTDPILTTTGPRRHSDVSIFFLSRWKQGIRPPVWSVPADTCTDTQQRQHDGWVQFAVQFLSWTKTERVVRFLSLRKPPAEMTCINSSCGRRTQSNDQDKFRKINDQDSWINQNEERASIFYVLGNVQLLSTGEKSFNKTGNKSRYLFLFSYAMQFHSIKGVRKKCRRIPSKNPFNILTSDVAEA